MPAKLIWARLVQRYGSAWLDFLRLCCFVTQKPSMPEGFFCDLNGKKEVKNLLLHHVFNFVNKVIRDTGEGHALNIAAILDDFDFLIFSKNFWHF